MSDPTPWHRPGRWLVNPAYWDAEAVAAREHMPAQAFIIDATLPEGDDCVGHQLNWNTRLELMVRLDQVGVDAITLPSHATSDLEVDLVRSYRRSGCRTPLVAKGPGFALPLRADWKTTIKRQMDVAAEFISPSFLWSYADTTSDFGGAVTKGIAIDAIHEAMAYMKQQGAQVIPWIDDTMRMRVDTAMAFAHAMAESGADGVYLVDSRGNSTPLGTRVLVERIRSVVGSCPLYVQHHNDLGVATANALAAVEGGAAWVDASVLGIGDRGGCVALEEIAVLLAMYGVHTHIRLDALYELGCYVRDAFGVALSPWKPLIGDSWNKEEGRGHLSGAADSVSEATIGVSPEVIGRQFEAVIGGKVLFGRERSSVLASESALLRDLVSEWGWAVDDAQFAIIVQRARAAVATSYGRHYLRFNEFRSICEGVLGPV